MNLFVMWHYLALCSVTHLQEESFLQVSHDTHTHTCWRTRNAETNAQPSVKGPQFVTGPWAHPESGRTNEAWRFILKTLHRELPVCINGIKCNNKSSCKTATLNKYDLQRLQIDRHPPKTKLQRYDQRTLLWEFLYQTAGLFSKIVAL